ncbi:hypothetical protein Dsin_008756 [Dipteronia sinensis]|uniref:IBH1-like N-terminal domain-containing protein n=1 Tax=Dipteronia sinensis TaxID=43782 RepID=A0AAE0APA7_9ROSI|nr:hypothetical protein Dsin_008756 [Dipteronia sinensis]
MRAPISLKQKFLKKWISGLQLCSTCSKNMSILERKKSIKLSADIAMASARNGRTCWSLALIANASKNDKDKLLVEHILGNSEFQRLNKISIMRPTMSNKRVRCKKILKRSCGTIRRVSKRVVPPKILASCVAKRLSTKRTQVLKSLVPGGEFMDDVSLIEETLDYIMSLQTQIDIMRSLANATELVLSRKNEQW